MNEVKKQESNELSTDLKVITAEINSYKQIAGQAIFEIGRRLKHVRDEIFKDTKRKQDGEWRDFLRCVDFDVTTAKRFIKVYEEFGNQGGDTWHRLSMRVLYEIATMPQDEREKEHVILSTGETKAVEEMTVRELREVKQALKEAQERELALKDTLEAIQQQPPKVEVRTQYVKDESYVEELRRYRDKFGDINLYEDDRFQRMNSSENVVGTALMFSNDVMDLVKKYSFLEHYEDEFSILNAEAKKEYQQALETLKSFVLAVDRSVSGKSRTEITIDADFKIYEQ